MPGLSNSEAAQLAEISDPGEISKLASLRRAVLIGHVGEGQSRRTVNAGKPTSLGWELRWSITRSSLRGQS